MAGGNVASIGRTGRTPPTCAGRICPTGKITGNLPQHSQDFARFVVPRERT